MLRLNIYLVSYAQFKTILPFLGATFELQRIFYTQIRTTRICMYLSAKGYRIMSGLISRALELIAEFHGCPQPT